jgi:hypothetical protein
MAMWDGFSAVLRPRDGLHRAAGDPHGDSDPIGIPLISQSFLPEGQGPGFIPALGNAQGPRPQLSQGPTARSIGEITAGGSCDRVVMDRAFSPPDVWALGPGASAPG